MLNLGRRVTVVLCGPTGELLGSLPPIDLGFPWYARVDDLVDAVRERNGLRIIVLRLLDVDRPQSAEGGGHLVHLAQVVEASLPAELALDPVPALPAHALVDQPLRAAYARPGGPQADLAWAEEILAGRGMPRTGEPKQMRTWNLSCIWALPTAQGRVWLKSVPRFFGHEGAMLALLASGTDAVPALLGHEGGRVLLGDVPGEDHYFAPTNVLRRMVPLLVGLQVAAVGRVEDLLATGAFDWRPPGFDATAADVVERTADQLDPATRAALCGLLDGLPGRHAAIAACGIPDTLVHGDFHPGNVRGDDDRLVMLDWGDSGVGHPLLDQAAFLERVPGPDRHLVLADWSALWRKAIPGSNPDRAADLIAPVVALRQAVIYRLFLDHIEPAEQSYHSADPALWLRRAVSGDHGHRW
ncbi:MAG TPA: aminoglycoside phosphotransferase family protein [Dermatophilaceae bacterium]|nr:aminoglycoside phosphotransferase family protein [Dermatophilaceae bacterium]